MAELNIASGFALPLDAITETFAILARRGSGKTYSAAVIVEEVIGAGHPVVIIDPLGVWWGLRSSADGKRPGLPVVIFGGEHADLPLAETQGAVIAEAIVEGRFPAIIDLSLLSKSAARRFNADFLEVLYRRNRDPLLLVVDEADLLAPQRTAPEGARVLGAMEDVVRRGRARGLGCVLITQRPAVLNKDVLSQASVLVALRMGGKHDITAIDEWIRLHADEDDARELKASLPSLPVGTAWIWSPGWLGVLRKVKIRRRTTFDSSATPKVGEARIVPTRLADIDLDALGAKLATARDQVAATDPKALQRKVADQARQIAQLAADLERARATAEPQIVERTVTVEVPVEVPVLDADARAQLAALEQQLADAAALLAEVRDTTRSAPAARPAVAVPAPKPAPQPRPAAPRPTAPPPAPAEVGDAAGTQVRAGARRILETLARQHPQRLTKAQLGTLAKFKVTGGTFNTYWGLLRRLGYIDIRNTGGAEDYTLTDAGFAFIGVAPGNPQSTQEILETWRSSLRAGARAMLDVLVEVYPASLSRDELADRVGMAASGGTFNTYLGTLRRNGLAAVVDGQVAADPVLFGG